MMATRTIHWGILGAGRVAHRFVGSLMHVAHARVVAISGRAATKVATFAIAGNVDPAHAHLSHEALLDDKEVDAIYLALPPALHKEWAIRALHAGKTVLCEKPACTSAAEMREVIAAAQETGMLFMEAMKPRFVPLYAQVREAATEIGEIMSVDASLCLDVALSIRAQGDYQISGGAGSGVAIDLGTYCASWIEEYLPGVPHLVGVNAVMTKGVDHYVDARLTSGGRPARLECAFDRTKPSCVTIAGTAGSIIVDGIQRPTHATVALANGAGRVIEAPYVVDDFYGEIHHFCKLMRRGCTQSDIMSPEDSLHCALILDVVRDGIDRLWRG